MRFSGGKLLTIDTDPARRDEAFDRTRSVNGEEALQALEMALVSLVNDSIKSKSALDRSLLEIANDPKKREQAAERALDNIINDKLKSAEAFEHTRAEDLAGERGLAAFLETAHAVLEDLGGDELANVYFNLLAGFIEKFSLRYDLRRPCTLCPTLTGVFASLVRDLRDVASRDVHLDSLMKDFESSIRDLRTDCSGGRIKTCIQKEMNLLEAIGRTHPGVTGTTLGTICNEVGTWPHEKIKDAMKALYVFASDYPGIRHGGTPTSAIRDLEMRDMVAMSILLAGFTPYLTDQLNPDMMYRGS
jgi:hypothetical protein